MKVYRLAYDDGTKLGAGPYSKFKDILEEHEVETLCIMCEEHIDESHIDMKVDIGVSRRDYLYGNWKKEYYCVFPTLEALEKWFEGYLASLIDMGFVVMEIETSYYLSGKSQTQGIILEENILNINII